jgi:hypothetical protein
MASPAIEDSIADARGQCGQLAWPIATGAEQLDLALEVSPICLEKVIYMEKEASSLRRTTPKDGYYWTQVTSTAPQEVSVPIASSATFPTSCVRPCRTVKERRAGRNSTETLDGGDP